MLNWYLGLAKFIRAGKLFMVNNGSSVIHDDPFKVSDLTSDVQLWRKRFFNVFVLILV